MEKVSIVGGGLVGALEACYMAKKGYEVHLYEYRKDIRTLEHVPGRSINLALSVRGLTALDGLGLGDHMRNEYGIPMHGRLIHTPEGDTYPVPYGKKGQCIYSVGRRYMNEILLTAGEKYDNLHFHFEHKLTNVNVDEAKLTFQLPGESEEKTVTSDFILGCDGAFSTVRKAMMRKPRFNYSQEYIPSSYLELCIPPTEDGEFAMPPNYLHIWPRGTFMLIALPNQDRSFTVTLFMPYQKFDELTDASSLLAFFSTHFADSIPLIGKDRLVADFLANPAPSLVSVKCSPYNWSDKCMILGDAAHAMVPFYGQGMNCGMEDVCVLDEQLALYPLDRKQAFDEYSKLRNPDAEAICDLAMYNYVEMRDLVAQPGFLIRKKLDGLLHRMMPSFWVPLYTSVTFTRMRYHQCIENKKWQDQVLGKIIFWAKWGSLGAIGAASATLFVSRRPDMLEKLGMLRTACKIF